MLPVFWQPIDHGTYAAIYANVHDKLTPFASHTCMDGCEWHIERHVLTEWGFKDADAPLIRSLCEGSGENEKLSYWIAEVTKEPADD